MSLNDPSEMRKDCVKKKNKNKHSSFTVILQRIKILLAMNKFYSLITVECRSCINTKNKHIPQIFQFQLKCPYKFALFMHCPLLLSLRCVLLGCRSWKGENARVRKFKQPSRAGKKEEESCI